jgi:hypothetical protein
MMQTDATLDQLIEFVELNGVYVEQEIHGWPTTGVDMLFPHLIILLCLRGSARVLFDMQEMVIEKNDFGVLMPAMSCDVYRVRTIMSMHPFPFRRRWSAN